MSQNLAVCFAHRNYKVVIVDTDTNNSCEYWSGQRQPNLPPISVFSITDNDALKNNIQALNENYDFVIIDGTPALSKLVSTIMLLGDLIIIPIKPSGLDVHATYKFMERYEEVRILKPNIKARLLLNQYDINLNFSKEVFEQLQQLHIPTLESTIKNRIAYIEAVVKGIGVLEYKDDKAKTEILQLTDELMNIITHFNS